MNYYSYLWYMKTYKVYKLVNTQGTIEYVGQSKNPLFRFKYNHLKNRFKDRYDLSIHIIKEFDNLTDALNYECEIKHNYGFKCTEKLTGHKPINVYTKDGIFVDSFISLTEASKKLNLDISGISYVLNGKRKTHKGYKFNFNKIL